MTSDPATYPGYRFPAEIISHAIWLYHVFSLSLRDVELILAERGISITHESIRQWGLKFGDDFARKLRRRRPRPGDTWHMDEVFLRITRQAALPLAGRRSARRGARHPGAGAAERHGGQTLLQAPTRRSQVQAGAHHH
jgi:putative transposase